MIIDERRKRSELMDFCEKIRSLFGPYTEIFLELNHRINLMSRKEERYLLEKHIIDSLSLGYFAKHFQCDLQNKRLLDVGTGGGFPAVPLAIYYPKLKITALDSIGKKIRAVDEMIKRLALPNITTVLDRVENYQGTAEIVTARAVAPLIKLLETAANRVAVGGYFVAYKGSRAEEELAAARGYLTRFGLVECGVISYSLPLLEDYQRNLVVFQRTK